MSFRFTQSITRVFQYYLEVEAARKRVLAQRMKGRCGGVCVTIDAYCRVLKIDVEKKNFYIDSAKPNANILKEHKQLCLDVKVAVWDAVAKMQKLKLSERAKIGTPPAGAQPSSMTDALSLRPYPYEAIIGEHELSAGVDDKRTGGKYAETPRYADHYVTSDKYLSDGDNSAQTTAKLSGESPVGSLAGGSPGSAEVNQSSQSGQSADSEEKSYPEIPRKEHYAVATGVLSNSASQAPDAKHESGDNSTSPKNPLFHRKSTPALLSWIGAMHRECTTGIGGVASFSKHMMAVLLAAEDPARVLEIQRQQMSMEEKAFWNRVDVIRKAQQNTIKVPLEERRTYRDFDYKSSTNRYSPNYENRGDKSVTTHVGK